MYRLVRNILFFFDAEKVHYLSMNVLKFLCGIPFIRKLLANTYQPRSVSPSIIFHLSFPNKVGLAAGFDKNANYLGELETLGFGFVETGTVTPLPQDGNDKPRLFRLPKDKAIINRMGFNNDGVERVAMRLRKWKMENVRSKMVIGGNIGKNKITPNEEAWKDYEKCFLALHDLVDYFVVNVSSPNTPGLRELQEKDSLKKILVNLQIQNSNFNIQKPVLLKIAPDLTKDQIDDVIDLALEIKLDGLVASNTTISRENLETSKEKIQAIGAGGLSGLPLKQRSTEIVKYIHEKTKGAIPVIASGGIFTAADAKEKLDAGASLVQVWTGFIYEGPGIVRSICRGIQ